MFPIFSIIKLAKRVFEQFHKSPRAALGAGSMDIMPRATIWPRTLKAARDDVANGGVLGVT